MITATGVAVSVSAGALLITGTLADYPELVMLGSAGVAALVLATLWTLTRPRLAVSREVAPSRVVQGNPAAATVTVTNTGRHRSLPAEAIEVVAERRIVVPLPGLGAGRAFGTTYALPTERRGRHTLPGLVLGRSDPLRLMRTRRVRGEESVLYVHPLIHELAPVPAGGSPDAEGPTALNAPQGGVAFHSLRDYRAGDDWRRIHWKSTARTGTLLVRHTVVPDDPHCLVVLDTGATSYPGTSFEDAVRVAASLCAAAGRAGYPLALLMTANPRTAPDRPLARWDTDPTAALDLLADARCSSGDPGLPGLAPLLDELIPAGEGTVLTVVTGQPSPERLDVLTVLAPRFSAVSLACIGPSPEDGAAVPPGVFTITAATSAEFAAAWNRRAEP
ncbi:DUF58 domain-containing protein [Amycolatopsis sp. NPDC059021]|uniref:DUF58 domain-containing protein n=1 Tax=Amycolatopsis sp. NPDC059021 TaxID=3346704 RepID=UPI00366A8682